MTEDEWQHAVIGPLERACTIYQTNYSADEHEHIRKLMWFKIRVRPWIASNADDEWLTRVKYKLCLCRIFEIHQEDVVRANPKLEGETILIPECAFMTD
jgi:hypothetical protein